MSAAITDASSTTRRGHRLLPVVVGVLATVALTAGALTRPDLAPVLAGCVLLVVGFAVMAPCSIQMALTMSRVVMRTTSQGMQAPISRNGSRSASEWSPPMAEPKRASHAFKPGKSEYAHARCWPSCQ